MKAKIFKYIYAMLCLMPAIAVGVTCAYAIQNVNAYQSYADYTDTFSETVSTNDFDNLIDNTNAFLILKDSGSSYDSNSFYSYRVHFKYLTINDTTFNEGYFTLGYDAGVSLGNFLSIYDTFMNRVQRYTVNDTVGTYQFYYVSSNNNGSPYYYRNDMYGNEIAYILLNSQEGKLSNVFYYSIDKVSNEPVFSWVKDNFLYDGMNQFVGIFGGADSNISFYLTWVLTISLCYLGFETLMLFINIARNLIHGLTNKEF